MTRKEKRRVKKRKNDFSFGDDWTFRQKVYGVTKTTRKQKSVGL
jgi:hypothetical protein